MEDNRAIIAHWLHLNAYWRSNSKIIVGAREGREVWEQTMLMEIAYPNINHDGIKIQSTSYVSGKLY